MTDTAREYAQEKIAKKDFSCAKEYTLSMFSGKYKIVILYHLGHNGTMRFSQIQRLLDHASHKMLTQQLKEMADDNLVDRREETINNGKAVYYSLTDTGESLIPIVDDMFSWGKNRLASLEVSSDFN
ncbi:helix-turn-helix domain-containing protein [Lacticaseibacillus pabuli]|uniref:Helix-turn-helix domain-containing protein n=1 Tax=Lacticaseibacillus pabuli TaxID=3025672 RepID=A0ABY7WSR2_9LACO|nr:helix-turn-helix domain-containing protein [Lacticaseibacillus sp. KACC 23028]WDF83222.1 helix-turn-helix domain-containing protein [Lacticaseibacillus sp. KACC 23028]